MAYDEYYYYGLAAAAFIATSLVIAAVRWFHMCRPYDSNARYYYPGRPFVVAAYLNSLVLLPYALRPDSGDAWYLARMYFLPVTLFHFTVLLFSYFGNVMQWKKWRTPMLTISIPVALTMAAALVLAIWPGEQLENRVHPVLAGCMLYFPGGISSIVCIASVAVVRVWARRFNEDDYSNQNDFPVVQAKRWTLLIFISLLFCWIAVLTNNRTIMAIVMLIFAIASVVFIISALHPHRTRPMENEEEEAPAEATPKRTISKKKRQEILSSIHIVVVEQQAYLESHLTIQDVSDRSGYSRSYIASIIKSEYGGFFDYINKLRLQSVAMYLEQHPDATIQEAAEASGFNSRQAYYTVKARLEKK